MARSLLCLTNLAQVQLVSCTHVMQRAQPSPKTYILVIDPVHILIRLCNRNRPAADTLELSGSGGFADDTTLQTDGPDAVPAM